MTDEMKHEEDFTEEEEIEVEAPEYVETMIEYVVRDRGGLPIETITVPGLAVREAMELPVEFPSKSEIMPHLEGRSEFGNLTGYQDYLFDVDHEKREVVLTSYCMASKCVNHVEFLMASVVSRYTQVRDLVKFVETALGVIGEGRVLSCDVEHGGWLRLSKDISLPNMKRLLRMIEEHTGKKAKQEDGVYGNERYLVWSIPLSHPVFLTNHTAFGCRVEVEEVPIPENEIRHTRTVTRVICPEGEDVTNGILKEKTNV